MVRQYRKFDEDFKSGAVRLVFETGKPIAQVARDLGVNEGTLGNWVTAARRQRDGGDGPLSEDERAELAAGAARTQLAEASPRSRSNKIGNHKSGVSTVSGDCRNVISGRSGVRACCRRPAAMFVCPVRRRALSARVRRAARFWGPLAVRIWLWSSASLTSRTQCRPASIDQCPRTQQASCAGSASWASRLVMA